MKFNILRRGEIIELRCTVRFRENELKMYNLSCYDFGMVDGGKPSYFVSSIMKNSYV